MSHAFRLALAGSLALAACNTTPARGVARPTVEGSADTPYPGYEEARAAFTRNQGPLTAVLADASWIRLEPDRASAECRHPEYFQGLTVFDVTVQSNNFCRPTEEDYLLEDSTGVRVTTKPNSFKGDVKRGFGPHNLAMFKLVFAHAMSKDVRWLRLTRNGPEGGVVQWDFPGCEAPATGIPAPVLVPPPPPAPPVTAAPHAAPPLPTPPPPPVVPSGDPAPAVPAPAPR